MRLWQWYSTIHVTHVSCEWFVSCIDIKKAVLYLSIFITFISMAFVSNEFLIQNFNVNVVHLLQNRISLLANCNVTDIHRILIICGSNFRKNWWWKVWQFNDTKENILILYQWLLSPFFRFNAIKPSLTNLFLIKQKPFLEFSV